MIMQTTLARVITDKPNTRTITLACGHVFTLETLDGLSRSMIATSAGTMGDSPVFGCSTAANSKNGQCALAAEDRSPRRGTIGS